MLKRPKKIEKVQISQTSFFKAKRKISPVKTFTKTPSPESIIRVNNKLELLTSFKTSFQSQRSINRNLTPIPRTLANIPNIDLTTLDIKNYGLGDNQAKVLSSAIKSMNRLEKINLRGNGIKDSGTFSILNSLNRSHIRVLDVSNNSLGTRAIETLSEIINDESAVIEEINLENSKISQSGLSKLCRSLMHNKTVKVLNLANNHIGVGSGTHLGDMLDYNSYLESLDLQWNFIRASEAILFFQSLKNNNSVKVLDLSWNSLGQDKISQSISVISESLRFNDTLQHIDLSNNTFSYEDCIEISKRLQNNHSIKGLHIEGNHGKIDSLGFLIPIHRIITPISSKKAKKITTKPLSKSSEHCWICNNWADVVIEWDPSRVVWNRRLKHFAMDKLSTQVEPVFVHLEIDEFTPFLLNRNEENVYFCIRALPPGKFRFFFTYRGVAQISNQYSVEAAGEKIEKVMHFYGDFSKTIMAVVVNFSDNANTELNSVPRPEIYEYTPLPGDVPEPDIPPWQLENSIFAGFIQDSPELLSKCFEADWSNSKLTKLFKSDVNKFTCKEMIKEEYAKM